MKYKDKKFSRELRFAIGIEEESGKYFLSIPVKSVMHVDFEEYYEISEAEFNSFMEDLENGAGLANRCREHLEDDRLFEKPKPGEPRGFQC